MTETYFPYISFSVSETRSAFRRHERIASPTCKACRNMSHVTCYCFYFNQLMHKNHITSSSLYNVHSYMFRHPCVVRRYNNNNNNNNNTRQTMGRDSSVGIATRYG